MSSNLVRVSSHPPVEVSAEMYPWINAPLADVPTVVVELDEATFLYGSMVGLNNSVRKLADSVTDADSSSLQAVLFSGLPAILSGQTHKGIGKVEGSEFVSGTLFTASRNIVREPTLIFALADREIGGELPVVLRAGVGMAKNLPRLLGVMGIKQVGGNRRKT